MSLINHLPYSLGKETIRGKVYSIYYSPLTQRFVFFDDQIPAFQMTLDEITLASESDSSFLLISYLAYSYSVAKSEEWKQYFKSVMPLIRNVKESLL